MFGRNPLRKRVKGSGETLLVHSIFPTIQGEGPLSGKRSVFVRLGGCNLACWWCDTEFEQGSRDMHVDTIVAKVADCAPWTSGCLVVLTGGEPLRQPVGNLLDALLGAGHSVQIETSGSLWTPLPEHDDLMVVVSPKTGKVAKQFLDRADAWKYVVRAGEVCSEDGLPTTATQTRTALRLARPPQGAPVYVSPCDDHNEAANQANIETAATVAMEHGYTLSLQTHKIIGVP